MCWHSFFGFLSGVTFACGAGYVYLTEDINESSREVQRSVTALSHNVATVSRRSRQCMHSVEQVSNSLSRLDDLERSIALLRAEAAQVRLDGLIDRSID
jgi:methyl-accepting chemotaxis protein